MWFDHHGTQKVIDVRSPELLLQVTSLKIGMNISLAAQSVEQPYIQNPFVFLHGMF